MLTRRQMLLGSVAIVAAPIVTKITPEWGYTALGPTGPTGPMCDIAGVGGHVGLACPGAVGPPGLPGIPTEVWETVRAKYGIDPFNLNPDGSDFHLIMKEIEDIRYD